MGIGGGGGKRHGRDAGSGCGAWASRPPLPVFRTAKKRAGEVVNLSRSGLVLRDGRCRGLLSMRPTILIKYENLTLRRPEWQSRREGFPVHKPARRFSTNLGIPSSGHANPPGSQQDARE